PARSPPSPDSRARLLAFRLARGRRALDRKARRAHRPDRRRGRQVRPGPEADDPLGELATGAQLLHRLADVRVADASVRALLDRRDECGTPEELLDVRGARTLGRLDVVGELHAFHIEAARVQLEETQTPRGVGHRELEHETDAPGAR